MFSRTLRIWLALMLMTFGWSGVLRADLIVLRNGSRIEGEVVGETPEEVQVRHLAAGTKVMYVQTIARYRIARIEKQPVPEPGLTATAPATRSADSPATLAAASPEAAPDARVSSPTTLPAAGAPGLQPDPADVSMPERQAQLASAIAKWKGKNYTAAGTTLSRLINTSSPPQLALLSAAVKRELSMSLADLAAQVHFRAALNESKGPAIHLRYVTPYERPALVQLLTVAFEAAMQREVCPTVGGSGSPARQAAAGGRDAPRALPPATVPAGTRPAAGPADPSRTITHWLDRPKEFDADPPTAKAMLGHLYYTNSLLSERIRYDPAVRTDPSLRPALEQDKQRLAQLIEAVVARAGGAPTLAEREAWLAELKQQQERDYYLQMREQQTAEQLYLRDAVKSAEGLGHQTTGQAPKPPAGDVRGDVKKPPGRQPDRQDSPAAPARTSPQNPEPTDGQP